MLFGDIDGRLVSIVADSFEDYSTGVAPPNWTTVSGTVETTKGGSDGSQAFENNYETAAGEYYIESPDFGGEQPTTATFAYLELSGSGGQAYRLENSSGNPILRCGSRNPQVSVDHGGGTTELTGSPSPSYDAWRRFTITFDWANEEFDVLWEDIGGSTADQSASNLSFINSASGIHGGGVGEFNLGGGSNTAPTGDEWNDELYGVEK